MFNMMIDMDKRECVWSCCILHWHDCCHTTNSPIRNENHNVMLNHNTWWVCFNPQTSANMMCLSAWQDRKRSCNVPHWHDCCHTTNSPIRNKNHIIMLNLQTWWRCFNWKIMNHFVQHCTGPKRNWLVTWPYSIYGIPTFPLKFSFSNTSNCKVLQTFTKSWCSFMGALVVQLCFHEWTPLFIHCHRVHYIEFLDICARFALISVK